jgi:hypothetical protein
MADRTITDEMASLIKGMLLRGDDQSDIAACFLINGGRVSEINTGHSSTGQKFAHIAAASPGELPPPGPYPSAYELWRAKTSMWAARVALEAVRARIEQALTAVENAESRMKGK